jgi:RNA binding exosome subunit
LQVGKDLRNNSRSIKEIVQFDDEDLSEEKIETKAKGTLKKIDKIAALYLLATKQAAKLRAFLVPTSVSTSMPVMPSPVPASRCRNAPASSI